VELGLGLNETTDELADGVLCLEIVQYKEEAHVVVKDAEVFLFFVLESCSVTIIDHHVVIVKTYRGL